jgi:hypothetical protein
MNEAAVAAIWKSGAVRLLTADSGQRVQVLYPGRRARRPGCDFQDAVLMIGERRIAGDVEIHVSSSLWEGHGHRLNPHYRDIVLHVVLRENGGLPAQTASGKTVPTVALNNLLTGRLEELERIGRKVFPTCVYAAGTPRKPDLAGLLAAAGLARFALRVERFRRNLLKEDPGQVLYAAIARSLGYALNAAQMEELARHLPLRRLGHLSEAGLMQTQAAFFGAAGFLPAQRGLDEDDPCVLEMENAYSEREAGSTGMAATEWNMRVRPANHPCRRLAALAALLCRYKETGLHDGLRALVETSSTVDLRRLEKGLLVEADGYWNGHYDFGRVINRPAALLGRGRAAEIIVNAVLPWLAAEASLKGDRVAEYRITMLYVGYRGVPSNEITRHMREELNLGAAEVRGACRQQGLLHIYHSYCREKLCSACPVFTRRN